MVIQKIIFTLLEEMEYIILMENCGVKLIFQLTK